MTERYIEAIKQPLTNVKSDYLSVLERYTHNSFFVYSKVVLSTTVFGGWNGYYMRIYWPEQSTLEDIYLLRLKRREDKMPL